MITSSSLSGSRNRPSAEYADVKLQRVPGFARRGTPFGTLRRLISVTTVHARTWSLRFRLTLGERRGDARANGAGGGAAADATSSDSSNPAPAARVPRGDVGGKPKLVCWWVASRGEAVCCSAEPRGDPSGMSMVGGGSGLRYGSGLSVGDPGEALSGDTSCTTGSGSTPAESDVFAHSPRCWGTSAAAARAGDARLSTKNAFRTLPRSVAESAILSLRGRDGIVAALGDSRRRRRCSPWCPSTGPGPCGVCDRGLEGSGTLCGFGGGGGAIVAADAAAGGV